MAKKTDSELERMQEELLASVRAMKADKAAFSTAVVLTAASKARAKMGLSQAEFADLLGVSIRTLQEWEQGRREPTGAARQLLRVAESDPEVLRKLAEH